MASTGFTMHDTMTWPSMLEHRLTCDVTIRYRTHWVATGNCMHVRRTEASLYN